MEEDHRDKRQKSEILKDCFDGLRKTIPDGTSYYVLVNSELPEGMGAVSLVQGLRSYYVQGLLFPLEECLSTHHMHETSYCHTIYSFNTKKLTDFLDAIQLFGEIATQKVVIEPNSLESERGVLSMEYIGLLRHPGIRLTSLVDGLVVEAPTSRDLDIVNPRHALDFFRQCYQDTSQFTVLIAGDFDLDLAAKAVQKYLGSIPRIQCKSFPTNQSRLQKSPIIFPQSSLREEIFQDESGFVEVVICVPLKMDKGKQDRDEMVIKLLDMMVVRRLRRLLRAKMGHVYNISTKTLFDGKLYASLGSEEAVMTVSFCFEETSETWSSKDNKSIDWKLVDRVLQEIEDLRNGPSEVDIAFFREIELVNYTEQLILSYGITGLFSVLVCCDHHDLLAGSVLARMNLRAWMAFMPLWLIFSYTVGAFSLWGGGFLFHWGVIDYSGGYVIHLFSGIAGLVAAYWVGPRSKSDRERFPPNNVLLMLCGAGLLWMGWSGFNGEAPYAANIASSIAVLNTNICAATSLLVWTCLDVFYFGKPSVVALALFKA